MEAGYQEWGYASWYNEPYHGRPTASGEIYDSGELTAAHPSLEFGTPIQVTNLTNGLSVLVRVNDRGPFVQGRIVDLSLAAARAIQMVEQGIARVRLQSTRQLLPQEKLTPANQDATPQPHRPNMCSAKEIGRNV